jgi:hypothetical protein
MSTYVEYRSRQITEELGRLWQEEGFYAHEIAYLKTQPEDSTIRQRTLGLHRERKRVTQKVLMLRKELIGLPSLKCVAEMNP